MATNRPVSDSTNKDYHSLLSKSLFSSVQKGTQDREWKQICDHII